MSAMATRTSMKASGGSATGSRGIFESRASEAGGSDGLAFGELDGALGSEVIVTRLPGFEAGHAALDMTD
jgi:hypothetical protein